MTKQEQIEEMAKDIVRIAGLDVYGKAEELVNLGYRKLPEDSVVLSREEYKRLLDNAIRVDMEYLDHELAKTRKETAKEIYSKMYDFAYRTKSYYTDALNDIIAKIDETFNDFRIELESLLREYDVEVEE